MMLFSVFLNYNRPLVCIPGKIIILIYGFLFSTPLIFCQEINPQSSHIISFIIGSNQVKENILIPKSHTGPVFSASYRFEKDTRNLHAFNFSFGYSRLKTKLETEKLTWNGEINAGYSWGKSLISGEKIKFYMGVDLSYNLSLIEFPVWDESRAYWGTSISAGPFTRLKMTFNNNCSLISYLSFDLFGICSRPETVRLYAQEEWTLSNILKITNTGFSFTAPGSAFSGAFKNEYRINFKKGNFLSLHNSISYSTISEYNEPSFQTIRIDFGLGLGF